MTSDRGGAEGSGDDTIAAIATAQGVGALAVVRVSGAGALGMCERVCRCGRHLGSAPTWSATLGEVVRADGSPVDQVVILVMRGPGSATGEDLVEICCHGGLLVPRLVLRRVVEEGARPAEPGEFTRRAFLNGKIDLAQAEAVEAVVRASSENALAAALRQLRGGLSAEIGGLEDHLLGHLAVIEANIDFVEDDIRGVDPADLASSLETVGQRLEALLEAHRAGRYLREGLDVVIVGKPNVGKSSIFNRLLGRERAIVSEIPGTTRDVVDGLVGVNGLVLKVHDTAGMRPPQDVLEAEAVRRTGQAVGAADIAVVVLDASGPVTAEDHRILGEVAAVPHIVVANKIDLAGGVAGVGVRGAGADGAIRVSALKGWGIEDVTERLAAVARARLGDFDGQVMVNERHAGHLGSALDAARRARQSLAEDAPLELVASDVRSALESLGEITGRKAGDAVLNQIFSRFCIGK